MRVPRPHRPRIGSQGPGTQLPGGVRPATLTPPGTIMTTDRPKKLSPPLAPVGTESKLIPYREPTPWYRVSVPPAPAAPMPVVAEPVPVEPMPVTMDRKRNPAPAVLANEPVIAGMRARSLYGMGWSIPRIAGLLNRCYPHPLVSGGLINICRSHWTDASVKGLLLKTPKPGRIRVG